MTNEERIRETIRKVKATGKPVGTPSVDQDPESPTMGRVVAPLSDTPPDNDPRWIKRNGRWVKLPHWTARGNGVKVKAITGGTLVTTGDGMLHYGKVIGQAGKLGTVVKLVCRSGEKFGRAGEEAGAIKCRRCFNLSR